jgi:hypothetical protein
MNGTYLRKFLTRLTMNLPFAIFLPINLLLKPENDIIRLISFLCEFLACLTMIKSHVGSAFYTLFSLSIRVLPS